ncbi:MAG: NADH-quinone oxidoreductase subunit NuoE [Bacteroidales bacterium]|nr:NADH-quinone oxidoreductase subunit NuoE [Bacteroidales bacterium]
MSNVAELVKKLVEKYGKHRSSLLPVLQGVVEVNRYLSQEALVEVAKQMDIPPADVYGTATFYSFLDTVPRGRNIIRVCKTISCEMAGKEHIVRALEKTLKIKMGETTHDGEFSLLYTNCIGWCHKGPAMLVNDEPYTELTSQKAIEIIENYMSKSKN